MLLAGDEIGRSQGGNNNAYCQDSELSWIDWSAIDDKGNDLLEFTRRLISIRSNHPILERGRFLAGSHNPAVGVKDVTWLTPMATEMTDENWKDPIAKCFGMLLDGRAQESGIKQRATDETLLIVANSHHDVVNFTLPEVPEGRQWLRLFDTNDPRLPRERRPFGAVYQVTGRSMLLFLLEREDNGDSKHQAVERKGRSRKAAKK